MLLAVLYFACFNPIRYVKCNVCIVSKSVSMQRLISQEAMVQVQYSEAGKDTNTWC